MKIQFSLQIILLGILGGCGSWSHLGPTSTEITQRHFAQAETHPIPTLYCYKTLADHKCYHSPQKGKEHLLLGQYVPKAPHRQKPLWEHHKINGLIGVDPKTFRGTFNLENEQERLYPITQNGSK